MAETKTEKPDTKKAGKAPVKTTDQTEADSNQ